MSNMATKKTSQEGKQALTGRLMPAMRRSSAAGVLHGQAIAKKVGVNSSDLECLDLILLNGPSTAGEIARRTGLTSGAVTGLIDQAIAKKVGVNSSDLECLDLILLNGPSTAGEIARRTGLTSGAVTGLID